MILSTIQVSDPGSTWFSCFSLCVYFTDQYPLSKVPRVSNPSFPPNLPQVAWNPWTDIRLRDDVRQLNVSYPYGPVPDNFSQLIRQSYYAATTYMDAQVGRLLESVDRNGFSNNTIIVLFGDHGK